MGIPDPGFRCCSVRHQSRIHLQLPLGIRSDWAGRATPVVPTQATRTPCRLSALFWVVAHPSSPTARAALSDASLLGRALPIAPPPGVRRGPFVQSWLCRPACRGLLHGDSSSLKSYNTFCRFVKRILDIKRLSEGAEDRPSKASFENKPFAGLRRG